MTTRTASSTDPSAPVTNGSPPQGPYQLTAAAEATSTADDALTTAYDAAGNLVGLAVARAGNCLPSGALCSQRFAYDWDENGRLARARRWDTPTPGLANDPVPSGPASADLRFAYDATGQRTLKTAIGAGTSGQDVTTGYVFGSLELRRATFDGTDYVLSPQTEVGYLTGVGVGGVTLHYALESEPDLASGQLHVFMDLPDQLGSASLVIDHDTGELVEAQTYQPYGDIESDYRPDRWAAFRDDYEFSGKEDDVELGLQYYGERYLVNALGRWASPDPLPLHALEGDANLYAYVHGALLSETDPFGLDGAEDVKKQTGQGKVTTYEGRDNYGNPYTVTTIRPDESTSSKSAAAFAAGAAWADVVDAASPTSGLGAAVTSLLPNVLPAETQGQAWFKIGAASAFSLWSLKHTVDAFNQSGGGGPGFCNCGPQGAAAFSRFANGVDSLAKANTEAAAAVGLYTDSIALLRKGSGGSSSGATGGGAPRASGDGQLYGRKASSRVLGRNLENATGRGYMAKPSQPVAAHHIVAGGHRLARQARALLRDVWGIDINAAENGVWLPRGKGSTAAGLQHEPLHSEVYHREVLRRLQAAADLGRDRDGAIEVLLDIRADLLKGDFPH